MNGYAHPSGPEAALGNEPAPAGAVAWADVTDMG